MRIKPRVTLAMDTLRPGACRLTAENAPILRKEPLSMLVYVLNKDGQPLMPTGRNGKVRRLLNSRKAKVIKRCPFTIQLLYETDTCITQPVEVAMTQVPSTTAYLLSRFTRTAGKKKCTRPKRRCKSSMAATRYWPRSASDRPRNRKYATGSGWIRPRQPTDEAGCGKIPTQARRVIYARSTMDACAPRTCVDT